jgi:CDGSH iron-sulfur domain-containing protein 3
MELIPHKDLPKLAICEPAGIDVEPGKTYSWCSCGLSEKEPFCDSAHKNIEGLPFRSLKVVFDKPEQVWFCQCKRTKTPPFCDGTHKTLS